MIIGSKPARAGSGGAEIPKKLLSLLMAAVLALSLAPSAAWAQPEAPAAAPTEEAPVSYTHLTLPTKRIV